MGNGLGGGEKNHAFNKIENQTKNKGEFTGKESKDHAKIHQ